VQSYVQPGDHPALQNLILSAGTDTELRELREEDAERLFFLVDSNRSYLREWLPWVDQNKTPDDSRHFIRNTISQRLRFEALTYGIWISSDTSTESRDDLVGVIGFRSLDPLNRSGEIGYWLAESCQGKGIMTAACQALVDFGFETLKLHRVVIRCATGNQKSCRIPERLDFGFEGIAREAECLYDHFVDLNVYALLSHQWFDSNKKQ